MSEEKYNEVLKFIKSSLVPKNEFDESQNEITVLKLAIENANNELKKAKLENEEHKLAIDILQAEKESLEAEKITFQIKFNEVSLKLTQKTKQYDSLLKSQKSDSGLKDIDKVSTIAQTIKKEPIEIGIINVPSSSSSRYDESAAKTGRKRKHSSKDKAKRKKAKRKKREIRNSTKSKSKFSCVECLHEWGIQIQEDYNENPDETGAPDPKQKVPTFSSFIDFKDHQITAHMLQEDGCNERGCLLYQGHNNSKHDWPHGDFKCELCSLTFKFQKHHDEHMQFQHAALHKMRNNEIYDLFHRYIEV